MSRSTTIVIVGAGLAGAKAAEALRANDFDGHIVLFGSEEELPYERPPLSKEFLAGKKTLAEFTVHDRAWLRDHDVDLRLGTEVTAIDRHRKAVELPDASAVSYHKLILATGSRARRPQLPGADAEPVHYLRTVADAQRLSEALTEAGALAVIGAGWIGLEVAAVAAERGLRVTVAETARLPLLAALGPEIAPVFADLHRQHGVTLRTETGVQEILVDGARVRGLRLDDGTELPADVVLVAVGAAPNVELARQAGLALADGGVAVDAALRTDDPDIYAVGDIAAAEHPLLHTRIRSEHWANALKQPAVAAADILGKPASYDELPYFFTDQFDLGMEYVGHPSGYRRVVTRGDVDGRTFSAFWLDGSDRVLAGMNVNIWEGLDDIKALIRSRTAVDADRLGNPDCALTDVVAG